MHDLKVKLSEDFAVDIIKLSDLLYEKHCNSALITQIVKSGTSIGANISESLFAESKEDFIHKLKISLKEASETRFWLKILYRSDYMEEYLFKDLFNKCEVIIKIINSIIKKTR